MEEIERLSAQYKFAIVGKFSHGFPPYRNMHQLLSTLKLQGPFIVTMITNRHVLINLKNEANYTKLWIQLWHIDGSPMRMFKWTPSFRPQLESSLAPVWICFPTLPAHLFHKDVLYAIASLVGTPLKLDEPTLFQSRLTAARVSVEVDLANKLIEEIVIGLRMRRLCKKLFLKISQNIACFVNTLVMKNQIVTLKGMLESRRDLISSKKEHVAPPIGIESKNTFNVLNQLEGEDEGGRGSENDSVGRNAGTGTTGNPQAKMNGCQVSG
ncbi:UNVERIFIED_CONTAM: hypothetical protein Slati_1379000 [Sesamum latifolium]|uniref:DUF4283 domain-containing protein n=1 Tax=Sesamum latifolium TaxID=2727402 RepID=A0AAW2X7X1_9LAMI